MNIDPQLTIAKSSNDGGENVSKKVNSSCFKVFCPYSISFCLSNIGEFLLELNSEGLHLRLKMSCLVFRDYFYVF